jgi:hypothetical protein
MAIQRVRIWQWFLIALAVGGVLGMFLISADDFGNAGTLQATTFYQRLHAKTPEGQPVIHDIVIYPAIESANGRRVQRVTFMERRRNRDTDKWDDLPGDTVAEIPYRKDINDPDNRVGDFLKQRQEVMPELDYRYAWWSITGVNPVEGAQASTSFVRGKIPFDRELRWWQYPRGAWIVLLTGSVVVIGIIWPLVIRGLVKLGFGLPEDPNETGMDLSKVSSRTTQEPGGISKGVTDDDLDALGDLNARLAASVGDLSVTEHEPDEAEQKRAEAATIKKLSNAPAEPIATEAKPEDPKDFKGEYYPVARPHSETK